jgi:DNA (cytosine-5)-methyltransferase 1
VKGETIKNVNFSVISYFCGCGGMDLGFRGDFHYHNEHYKKLPFTIKAAYDNNAACIETYNSYFGENHAEVLDLEKADASKIETADVLIGGFPCQEFSSCGPQGGLDSERGQLYKTLVKYMKIHKPKIVVGENVVNLERMDNGNVLKTIKEDFEKAGYTVDVWKFFAPDYGIPQRRTRLFFLCVKNGIEGFPVKPEPKFSANHRSIKWAIGDIENIQDETIPNQSEYFAANRAKRGNGQGDENNKKDKPAYTIRANPKSRVQFHYSLERR